ncbi:MAG: 3-oxoacyl-[acyl-carrier-protein] reductase [candidate division WS1 bacterium]|jgi:3-oxoacyl-[acyl-carrier protein] reductase|nr:3-oxoacyl-[acyl-carrier-protein] reductase [candidate division WS1 bacterium]
MLNLTDRVAMITGGAGGLGLALADRLATLGANVVVNDIPQAEEAAERVAEMVRKHGRKALVALGSVTSADDVGKTVDSVLEEFGKIDILINNAGITRDGLLIRMSEQDWDMVLEINLKGSFLCTKAVARPMMKARYGRIVNIASVAGVMGNAGQANYSASKGGLIALTKTTAKELASRSITCNAVAPGFIETRMTEVLDEQVRAQWLQNIPLGRPGTPEDVADVVAFLASDAAAYVTGQVLNIDGGLIM